MDTQESRAINISRFYFVRFHFLYFVHLQSNSNRYFSMATIFRGQTIKKLPYR